MGHGVGTVWSSMFGSRHQGCKWGSLLHHIYSFYIKVMAGEDRADCPKIGGGGASISLGAWGPLLLHLELSFARDKVLSTNSP